MATTQRDYYEVLGVARGADEGEIKRAFRGLARELHPDVSEAPDAPERFREVVEAYEVLSKSETRELYDRFGHAGLRGGGFTPTQFDLGSLTDLFAAFFGDDLFGVGGRAARAACNTSRGARSVSSSERRRVRLAAAPGSRSRTPAPIAVGTVEESRSERSRWRFLPESMTVSRFGSQAKAMRAEAALAPVMSTSRFTSSPTRASSARATTSSR